MTAHVEAGLPASMLTCHGKGMLRDRVAYIRRAAIFNIHRDRHVLSLPVINGPTEGGWSVTTSFALFQSERDKDSRLFAIGYYKDHVVQVGGQWKFRAKTAVLENDSVMPLLSSPV
jgi:3-phenylpropionate/cinnamic acid dioxygenase small subunit